MKAARINVIDMHFALQAQTMRRNRDGIHWSPVSNRLCLVCSCGGVDLQYSCRLMTHISLTHLTLTMPQCGPHLLPGRMKTSISLTNLIRLKMKRKRKSSSTRRSLEVEGFNTNSLQQPYSGSPSFSVHYTGSEYYQHPQYYQYYGHYGQHGSPPNLYPHQHQQYYGQFRSPLVQNQFLWPWSPPVQPQQRAFPRRGRGAPRLRNRYHPYYPHYY